MNKPSSLISVLQLAITISSLSNLASAQSPSDQSNVRSPYRYTGGWNATNRAAQPDAVQNQNSPPIVDQSAVVQAAFYQPPGSGLGLPAYPGSAANAAPNNHVNDGISTTPPPLPTGMPNALAGQGGAMAGRPNDVEMPNSMRPPQNYQPNNQSVTPPPQQSQFDPYAREQQQVFPPDQLQSPYRTAGTDLRAVQNANQQNPAQNTLGNDLRPVAPTMGQGFGVNSQQIPVASGYPFVSPAPRVGNYPTSQYNAALFRPVAYQNVVQSPQAPLSAAAANTQPTLPQFQNPPPAGVYPTQYQCAPGTTSYPPPGAVPGSFVPPTLTPNLAPGTYSPNNSGYKPFFSLGQENYNVQLGRGIIGQPTVYVPGQPIRNFLRYLSP